MDYTQPDRWLFMFKRNVAYTTAHGAWGCVHVGSIAVFVLSRWSDAHHWRLEICTPSRWFRWSTAGMMRRRRARS